MIHDHSIRHTVNAPCQKLGAEHVQQEALELFPKDAVDDKVCGGVDRDEKVANRRHEIDNGARPVYLQYVDDQGHSVAHEKHRHDDQDHYRQADLSLLDRAQLLSFVIDLYSNARQSGTKRRESMRRFRNYEKIPVKRNTFWQRRNGSYLSDLKVDEEVENSQH